MFTRSSYPFLLFLVFCMVACKSAVKEQSDALYSRHLQKHINLHIVSTTVPDEKADMNLLLFNDAALLQTMDAKTIIDSLTRKKLIQPLLLVGIDADEKTDYGIADLAGSVQREGSKADKYSNFVMNELYPFIKKKTKIRKFKSVAIAGSSLAGIAAFDIAWDNADKIERAGMFSGNFDYSKTSDIVNPVLQYFQSSRKRPKLDCWFYAGMQGDTSIFKNTQLFTSLLQKKNTGFITGIQFVADKNSGNDGIAWRHHFAEFLLWAFAR